jgi:pyrimidine oxygenase|tara:strand:+ start:4400 stop:5455 length:1056 start_codon:yes stop_codon:yes gene_type:complete
MEFGVFIPIGNNGWMISKNSPQYMPSFELNKEVVQKAEAYGFGFVLSMVKLRGFGGETEFWDHNLESFTLMAGLASVTEKIQLYASVATLTMNPAMAARMALTIDDISGGRFGMNLVSGWNKSEYEQMGVWPGDQYFEDRYDYTTEYVQIMKELWSKGVSDFKGDHFQMEDCRCLPLPKGEIKLVSAGQSQRGMQFTAEHCDFNFIIGDTDTEVVNAANQQLITEAKKTGRDVGSYVLYIVILADTDEEAEANLLHYRDGADLEAIAFMTGQAGLDTQGATAARITELQGAAFLGIGLIVGSPETVAAKIDELAEVEGTKGMMLVFDDFVQGVTDFGEKVMPLLHCRSSVE